jgi:GNAT superfamily N-acetyltransferase
VAPLIRPAADDDLPALHGLYEEFHGFHVDGLGDRLRVPAAHEVDRAELDTALRALIERDDRLLLVADDGGRLVGFAEAYVDEPSRSPFVVPRASATLQSLLVTSAARGTGLGRALVAATEQWAASRGARELHLKTWEFDAGPLAFYESLGYATFRRELTKSI